ncbi:MAG: hypothetical protein WC627_11665 [Legionella sp.]|jgi:hypothetical protein
MFRDENGTITIKLEPEEKGMGYIPGFYDPKIHKTMTNFFSNSNNNETTIVAQKAKVDIENFDELTSIMDQQLKK